jgi:hypothetical protein
VASGQWSVVSDQWSVVSGQILDWKKLRIDLLRSVESVGYGHAIRRDLAKILGINDLSAKYCSLTA